MDTSQWLPDGIAIITPERQKMLGITIEYNDRGLIKYAKADEKKTVLQWLYDHHYINEEDLDNARDYQMWRELFRAFCSSQRMTANYGEVCITNRNGDGYREQAYCKVLHLLPKNYQGYIDFAIDSGIDIAKQRIARRYHGEFQRVFSRLSGVMNSIRETLDNDIAS